MADEARRKYVRWHRGHWLSPVNVLAEKHSECRAAYVPFWSFSGDYAVHWTASVKESSGQTVTERWARTESTAFGPETGPETLVYASYNHRRDFMEAAKLPRWYELAKPTPWDEALAAPQGGAEPEVDPPTLRQPIAWALAAQALTEAETQTGSQELRRRLDPGAEIKSVRAALSFSRRRAELVYLPVYVVSYTWGEAFNVHDERVPDSFLGIVSGSSGAGKRDWGVQGVDL